MSGLIIINQIILGLVNCTFFLLMQRCSNGPLLEVLMRNSLLCAKFDESKIEASITSDLQVNYNNIHKVLTVIRIMTI